MGFMSLKPYQQTQKIIVEKITNLYITSESLQTCARKVYLYLFEKLFHNVKSFLCISLACDTDRDVTNKLAFDNECFCINNKNINKYLSLGEVCLLQC